ncbi:Coenzyme Q-binding COQ10 mitochondrial [Micractinium conductrix]|uniref:Coenzyme Q-binding COQ10 mitochondrial n=1 Tax=Micractinium conductrix TaxID=554055 RepID=A0A2P6UYX5_9CHLO|nr:Coenzyme Q-binding COQ10 mitochondrial [Micractinium conductrix]|eukprot:PSC67036.1 Coenzyme Q-binding COQ10 mitochondrial [Micractinium conductrix]
MSSLLSQPRGCGPAVPIGPHTLSLSLLSLPEGLLHAIAALVPQYDRLRLGSVCRALRQACAAPTLFPELCLYLSGQRWQDPDAADELHRSLRSWVLKRVSGMHSLEITWLSDDFAEEPELPEPFAWQLHALIASLLSVLAPGLRRLSHSLIPIIFWKDTLLPLVSGGGSKLQVVALRLPSTAGLAALGGSLTELSIDTSESDGAALPDLSATLRRLPLLEDLQLSICETDPVLTTLSCLTCLTALRLAGFDVDGGEQEVLPPSCSRLTRLATLEFVGCSLLVVPPVLEGIRGLPHLTSLGLDNCGLAGSILPPGPYLSHLQLRYLNWGANRRVEVEAVHALLEKAPALQVHQKVTLHCPTAVHSRVDDSMLFSHLTNKWEFRLGPTPHTTWLTFEVDFAFKSPL